MWNGRAGQMLPGAAEAPERGGEETTLDRYIERETPWREFVRGARDHAPWWALSLLVHMVALFVVCRWPTGPALAVERESKPFADVGLIDPTPVPRVDPLPKTTLPPPPVLVDPVTAPPPEIGKESDPMVLYKQELEKPKAPSEGVGELPTPFGRRDGTAESGPAGSSGIWAENPIVLAEPIPNTEVIGVDSEKSTRARGTRRDYINRPFIPGRDRKGNLRGGPEYVREFVQGPINPILAGLLWLAKAQDKDGSWNAKDWGGASPYRVGMTGLALLSFEGMGFTHNKANQFEKQVSRGVEWLRKNQRPDGSFPWETFYEQGIATMAACEAYGMTRDSVVGHVAQAALDYIIRLQPEHGGFRYNGAVAKDEGDISVTGWQIMAIKSGVMAGLNVPTQAIARSRVFLANTARDYGTSAYLVGTKESGSLAVSAIGMACRIFLSEGYNYDGEIMQTAAYLRDQEIKGTAVRGGASGQLLGDLYYTYYSTLAMYQLQEEYWASWRTMFRDALLDAQERAVADAGGRYILGSWDPARDRWGSRAGRVYTTAMALLSLEVQYRFIALYRRAER